MTLTETVDPETGEVTTAPLTGDILPPLKGDIAAYDPFRAQLADAEKQNAALHFDYEDKAGNKAARSHIAQLRGVKGDLDRARKAEKDESLQRGRKIDAEANDIKARLEAMIQVHQAPIDAIEQRETDRLAAIQTRIDAIRVMPVEVYQPSAAIIQQRIDEVTAVKLDASFQELLAQAAIARDETLEALGGMLARAKDRETAAAELARLQKEAADRDQAARDEQIAKEAAEKATREAAAKAAADLQAAADRELQLRRDNEAANLRAENAAAAERKRIADEQAAKDRAEQARITNLEHRRTINQAAVKAITNVRVEGGEPLGVTEHQAQVILLAIIKEEVPHVSVNY